MALVAQSAFEFAALQFQTAIAQLWLDVTFAAKSPGLHRGLLDSCCAWAKVLALEQRAMSLQQKFLVGLSKGLAKLDGQVG